MNLSMNNGFVTTKKSPRGNTLVQFSVEGGGTLSVFVNLQTKEVEVFGVEEGVNGYELYQRMEECITRNLERTMDRAEKFSVNDTLVRNLNRLKQQNLQDAFALLLELRDMTYSPLKLVA